MVSIAEVKAILCEIDDSIPYQFFVMVRLGGHCCETSEWRCVLRWVRRVKINVEFTRSSL